MICNRITVSDFRNIRAADVTFSEGVNILHGKNAQGKTNLLEAIHLVSVGRSFRGAKEAEMIGFDAPFSTVSVDFTDAVRRQNLTLRIFRGKKRQIEQNKVKLTKMSEMIGQYRTVLFCPEHLSIVKEGPALRRNFLDVAISQLRPMYLHSLQRYNQILRERNQLIKNAAEDRYTFDSTIEFWSLQLAREAAVIATLRCEYLAKAKDYVKESFCEMTAGAEIPDLCYVGAGFRELDAEIYTDREAVERRYTDTLRPRDRRGDDPLGDPSGRYGYDDLGSCRPFLCFSGSAKIAFPCAKVGGGRDMPPGNGRKSRLSAG